MKGVELLTIGKELLKLMSKSGIKVGDCAYVEMYDEYVKMRKSRYKYWYVIECLSEKYGVSEISVVRIIRRLSKDVSM